MEWLAHIDHNTGREQTLRAHCEAVASQCAASCKPLGLSHLGYLIGLIHDAGKATLAFQAYLNDPNPSQRGTINHSACGARMLAEWFGLSQRDVEGYTVCFASAAVCGHHSGLPDCTTLRGDDGLYKKLYPERGAFHEEAVANFTRDCFSQEEITRLFQMAAKEVEAFIVRMQTFIRRLPVTGRNNRRRFLWGMTERFLYSALIDADRYDTWRFQTGQTAPDTAEPSACDWHAGAARVEEHLAKLSSNSAINQVRGRISQDCLRFSSQRPGVYRLCVPTGGGKTLSSLRFALHHADQYQKSHLFYIVPYKVILEQNAKDIREVLGDSVSILEHHGDVVFEEENEAEELAQYALLTERWRDCQVILTTMVQFLQTLFSGSSGCARRLQALAGSVIILDEIQSLPVKLVSMCNAALNFLSEFCGCTVILCTATQPGLQDVPVPLLLSRPEQMTSDVQNVFLALRRTHIVDLTDRPPFDATELAGLIREQLDEVGSTLAILNTKAAARAVFQAVRERVGEDCAVYCLTTSLCPAHRLDLLAQMRKALDDNRRVVCVSTQLIEAGVNISFPCVIRSLAGLDSIAQAAGRCNRHAEADSRAVYVVKCAEERLASLPDIVKGQIAAERVLEDFRRDSSHPDDDLLCPRAIARYYAYYYGGRQTELDFPVDERDDPALFTRTSLYSLLSENGPARKAVSERRAELPDHLLQQAFRTAGKLFRVIETNGIDVLVPYRDGAQIIEQIAQCRTLKGLPPLLRKAQRYTVHLFEGQKRSLPDGALIPLGVSGAVALQETFYREEVGVCLERKEMEPLIFG